jgi:NADPH2:quinone reductase
MSFEDAACLSLAYDTAWFALFERARFKSGDNVLVLGATGAVGRAAVQLARAKGANVIAGVSSLERGRSMLGNEAQHYVELSGPDLKENLRKQVFDLTGGKGADIVIDPLGGDIFDAAIRCVAWRGRFVIIGFAAGKIPSLKMNYVLLKNIEVSGLQISDYRKRTPELLRECFNDVFDLYEQGKIMTGKVFRFSLDDYSSALRGILDRSLKGRAVLVP